jgi:lipopolysaccharide export LptBFGC system permease protein LptF
MLKVFLLSAVGITLVMNFVAAILFLHKYPLPLASILKVLPYHMPDLLPWTFPIAMLMTTTLTYGRLASDNEILAMQMSGMHLMRPVMPALTLAVALTCVLFYTNDRLVPWCKSTEHEVYRQESSKIVDRLFRSGDRLRGGNYDMEWRDFRAGMLYNLTITQFDEKGIVASYSAERATYDYDGISDNITLHMKNLTWSDYRRPGVEVKVESRDEQVPVAGLFTRSPGLNSLTTPEMLWLIEEKYGPSAPQPADQYTRDLNKRRVTNIWLEIHQRFSLASSCFAFMLIGVPLGILARRAHMLSAFFMGCLPVMLVYYPVLLTGQSMAIQGAITPMAACWTPAVLLAAMGAALLGWLFMK